MTDTRDQSVGGSVDSASAGARVGPVTRDELLALIASGEVETVVLAAPDRHGRLFGKRVHAPFFAEDPEQGMMTCSVNVAWDLGQEFVGHLDYTGWHTGYHDMHGRPDMATARVLPWADKTALILCDLVEEDGADIAVAPRTMLRRQLARAAEAGLRLQDRLGARVPRLPRELRRGARQGLPRPHAGARLLQRLPDPRAGAGRALPGRRAPRPHRRRRPGGVQQGRVGLGPDGGEPALRRRAGVGRPPRALQGGREGARPAARPERDVHGAAVRGDGGCGAAAVRLELPHPHQPVGRATAR